MTENETQIRKISELASQLKRAVAAARLLKIGTPIGAVLNQLPKSISDDPVIRQVVMSAVNGYVEKLRGDLKATAESL